MTEDQVEEAELPLESVGARLARAREAAGLSRAAISARTRIPERQLAAIEAGDFAALPGRTYAVGFSRTYARALGLDEKAVLDAVREELAASEPERHHHVANQFEPGDPARVPSSRLAWLSALAAFAVIVAGFVWWGGYFSPGGTLPSILPQETPAPVDAPRQAAPAAAPVSGPVTFTAERDRVWVKFTDATGTQLMQKELVQGESYTLPEGSEGVMLTTARPDALAITVGGKAVPHLSEVQMTMRDVPVSAAALLARPAASGTPTATPIVAAQPPQRTQRRSEPRQPAVATSAQEPAPGAQEPVSQPSPTAT
jgi:transcriptional regulator with XRE-family HTH domain